MSEGIYNVRSYLILYNIFGNLSGIPKMVVVTYGTCMPCAQTICGASSSLPLPLSRAHRLLLPVFHLVFVPSSKPVFRPKVYR